MTKRRKVHVTDLEGRLLYTRLWDDGSSILSFDNGHGFVDKLDVNRYRWQVKQGWKPTRSAS